MQTCWDLELYTQRDHYYKRSLSKALGFAASEKCEPCTLYFETGVYCNKLLNNWSSTFYKMSKPCPMKLLLKTAGVVLVYHNITLGRYKNVFKVLVKPCTMNFVWSCSENFSMLNTITCFMETQDWKSYLQPWILYTFWILSITSCSVKACHVLSTWSSKNLLELKLEAILKNFLLLLLVLYNELSSILYS